MLAVGLRFALSGSATSASPEPSRPALRLVVVAPANIRHGPCSPHGLQRCAQSRTQNLIKRHVDGAIRILKTSFLHRHAEVLLDQRAVRGVLQETSPSCGPRSVTWPDLRSTGVSATLRMWSGLPMRPYLSNTIVECLNRLSEYPEAAGRLLQLHPCRSRSRQLPLPLPPGWSRDDHGPRTPGWFVSGATTAPA